jgi:hypothetical protein
LFRCCFTFCDFVLLLSACVCTTTTNNNYNNYNNRPRQYTRHSSPTAYVVCGLATASYAGKMFQRFQTIKHMRDFTTAGVAAGIAAAFGAPIGGLMFAFEEVRACVRACVCACVVVVFAIGVVFAYVLLIARPLFLMHFQLVCRCARV